MEIKKINNKVKLNEENVQAEFDKYKCTHDCIEYGYTGKNAAKGCRRTNKVTAKSTASW